VPSSQTLTWVSCPEVVLAVLVAEEPSFSCIGDGGHGGGDGDGWEIHSGEDIF
jgi:hypothetical protein